MRFLSSAVVAALAVSSVAALAQVKMSGGFVADTACPALVSIKKQSNPGNIATEPGKTYALLGRNKDVASHYWITVPDAKPSQRWVAIACGHLTGEAITPAEPPPVDTGDKGGKQPFYVFALSWEPAFCEALPDKTECRDETAASFEAIHLSLHGLWPQPRNTEYCGVDSASVEADRAHRWEDLAEPEMSTATKAGLDRVMPGTKSLLERHEWVKHGTCAATANADAYFAAAVRLTDAINTSAVQTYLAAHVGKTVTMAEIRAAFDQTFGPGSGLRVRSACKDDGSRRLLTELTVGIKGEIATADIRDLIAASQPTDSGCPTGLLDPVGLQ